MPQTIPAARTALVDKLKLIKGATSGHQLNFGGRVYDRLLLPEELGAGETQPYLCVPVVDHRFALTWYDRHVEIRWQQPIWAFVIEDSTSMTAANSPIEVLKAVEDIVESCLKDRDLGGKVKDWRILDGDAVAGVDPESHWGELFLVAELFITHGEDSI